MAVNDDTRVQTGKPVAYGKLTKVQVMKMTNQVIMLIGQGWDEDSIRESLTNQGMGSGSAIRRVLTLARGVLVNALAGQADTLAHESIAFYRDMCHDQEVSHKDRLRARERLDTLLGHDRPKRVDITVEADVDATAMLALVNAAYPGRPVPTGQSVAPLPAGVEHEDAQPLQQPTPT